MPLFLDAQEKWDDFLENKITNYEKQRNFDYGPTNKSSVSKLSPYISHRVLLEYKLVEEVKKKYHSPKINKFVEEIFYLSQGFINIDSNLTLGVKKLP